MKLSFPVTLATVQQPRSHLCGQWLLYWTALLWITNASPEIFQYTGGVTPSDAND